MDLHLNSYQCVDRLHSFEDSSYLWDVYWNEDRKLFLAYCKKLDRIKVYKIRKEWTKSKLTNERMIITQSKGVPYDSPIGLHDFYHYLHLLKLIHEF